MAAVAAKKYGVLLNTLRGRGFQLVTVNKRQKLKREGLLCTQGPLFHWYVYWIGTAYMLGW